MGYIYMSANNDCYGEYYKKFFEDYYTENSNNQGVNHNIQSNNNDKIIDIKIDNSNLKIIYEDSEKNVYEKNVGSINSSDSKLTHVAQNDDYLLHFIMIQIRNLQHLVLKEIRVIQVVLEKKEVKEK